MEEGVYYLDNDSILKIKCPKGHVFYMSWSDFESGKRCPECAYEEQTTKPLYEEIKKLAEEDGIELLTTKEEYEK